MTIGEGKISGRCAASINQVLGESLALGPGLENHRAVVVEMS